MTIQQEKCEEFARLHQGPGAFVIPNPWDVGSARLLEGLGFHALATTSAGFAFTLGRSDGKVTLEEKLAHCRAIAAATRIPLSADFEDGFGADPNAVAGNVRRLAETGVAGCSIEDFGRETQKIYDFALAVERVHAAAEAVATLGMPFQLTARAENLLRGIDDLDDTVKRLQAYDTAGADVLYAPAIASLDVLRDVTSAVRKPFNALAVFFPGATVEELAAAGARRLSVGSGLAWASLAPVLRGAKETLERGTFSWTAEMAMGAEAKRYLAPRAVHLARAAGGIEHARTS